MSDQNDYNSRMIEEFRANGGKVSGSLVHVPLLVLTTIGARSGQRRTTLIGYQADGDRLLVLASYRGAPNHPDWYYNLVAHPEVTIEVGTETFDAIATVIEGVEREQLWNKAVESFPFLAEHQANTTRQIPVVALTRRES